MSILSQTDDSNLETSAAGRFLAKVGLALALAIPGAAIAQAPVQAQNVSATTSGNSAAYQQAFNASTARFMQPQSSNAPNPQIAKELAQANATLEGIKEAYVKGDEATQGAIDGMLAKAAPIVQEKTYRIVAQHNQVMQPADPKLSTIEAMQFQIDQAGRVAVPATEYAEAKQTAQKPNFLQQHGGAVGTAAGVGIGLALHASPVGMLALGVGGGLLGHAASSKAKSDFASKTAQNMGSSTDAVDGNPAWFIAQAVQQVASAASVSEGTPQLRRQAAPANSDFAANHGTSSGASLVSVAGGRNTQTASVSSPSGLPD